MVKHYMSIQHVIVTDGLCEGKQSYELFTRDTPKTTAKKKKKLDIKGWKKHQKMLTKRKRVGTLISDKIVYNH